MRAMTMLEKAEAAERELSEELDRIVVKSVIYTSGEQDPRVPVPRPDDGRRVLMGPDPRLVRMPDRPTLFDFFRYRFRPATHLLQSARLAQRSGASEKIVLACLLHDIAILGFIRGDHGYWAAQLVAPYVDEEVSWAIRYHQALRFYPDESVGYRYPDLYLTLFGPDYRPDPHIERDYRLARAPVVHERASDLRQRPLRLRSRRPRRAGRVLGHRGPPLQAARGGPGLRCEPLGAHVAHDQLSDEVPVGPR
jgi:predicted HD phosphohydrolase